MRIQRTACKMKTRVQRATRMGCAAARASFGALDANRREAARGIGPQAGTIHSLGTLISWGLMQYGSYGTWGALCCTLHVVGGAGAGQSPADGKHPEADSHLSLRPAGRASARLAQALPSISSPRRIVRKLDANVFIASPGRMRTSARWLGSGRQCTRAARWPVS